MGKGIALLLLSARLSFYIAVRRVIYAEYRSIINFSLCKISPSLTHTGDVIYFYLPFLKNISPRRDRLIRLFRVIKLSPSALLSHHTVLRVIVKLGVSFAREMKGKSPSGRSLVMQVETALVTSTATSGNNSHCTFLPCTKRLLFSPVCASYAVIFVYWYRRQLRIVRYNSILSTPQDTPQYSSSSGASKTRHS